MLRTLVSEAHRNTITCDVRWSVPGLSPKVLSWMLFFSFLFFFFPLSSACKYNGWICDEVLVIFLFYLLL